MKPANVPTLISEFLNDIVVGVLVAMAKDRRTSGGVEASQFDTEKHVTHWRHGAAEDWPVAVELVDLGHTRHGLLRLAERSGLVLSETQRTFLARFDRYQLEGRYPDLLPVSPSLDLARRELEHAEEVFEWLNSQL